MELIEEDTACRSGYIQMLRHEVRRLTAKGHKLREIGRLLGYSRHAVTNTLRREPLPTAPPPGARRQGGCHLTSARRSVSGSSAGDTTP